VTCSSAVSAGKQVRPSPGRHAQGRICQTGVVEIQVVFIMFNCGQQGVNQSTVFLAMKKKAKKPTSEVAGWFRG
jgi:hypothetical protein